MHTHVLVFIPLFAGYTQVIQNTGDYSAIAADNGNFVASGGHTALNAFRAPLSHTDYQSLQTATNSKFYYNNCTVGTDAGCVANKPFGSRGPVTLLTYRNRVWNKPSGSCTITCTYVFPLRLLIRERDGVCVGGWSVGVCE